MSVVQKFDATSVEFSEEDKIVHVYADGFSNFKVKYTFSCKTTAYKAYTMYTMFFDMSKMSVLVVYNIDDFSSLGHMSCYLVYFWIEDDLPVFSSTMFILQKELIHSFADDFKEKLASYTLDKIINQ